MLPGISNRGKRMKAIHKYTKVAMKPLQGGDPKVVTGSSFEVMDWKRVLKQAPYYPDAPHVKHMSVVR